jgi:hypothetical protein
MAASTDVNPGGTPHGEEETTKAGPANPQGSSSLDAPTPPGGPLRSDAPGATTPAGPGTPAQPGEPQEPRRPTREVQEPIGGSRDDTGAIDENAQTSQGEPSDDSGHE